MEYTNIFEPLLIICLTLCLGILIGCAVTLWVSAKDLEATNKKLDKFRGLYFEKVREWEDKYVDDNPCGRFKNNN
jgi:uncharacterized protein YneF (UPF0154 family)|tara:strand:- start:95 stop:319 length:225 start_codon:yes stop_codon:yes gene_type:complete